jgi:hypothetical protein
MSFKSASALVGAFAASALAHGTVTSFRTDGVSNPGYDLSNYYLGQNGQEVPDLAAWSAENLDNGFVGPDAYGTVDINCHKNAAPGAITASVQAGGTVDFLWSDWPDSHFGPVFTYVASCGGDCAAVDPAALEWVKIDEGGIDIASQTWAATDLINNNNTWTTTVPSTLVAGNYVFRHEIIAMHGAGDENGAQNYPQCFNIEVTGSGTDSPEGVLGTELYSATDAGIRFNPYTTIDSYEIPGPTLYGSGSTQPEDPETPEEPASTTVATSTVAASPTVVVTPTVEPTPTSFLTSVVQSTAAASSSDVSSPAPTEEPGSGDLPETFTIETFIAWLQEKAGI